MKLSNIIAAVGVFAVGSVHGLAIDGAELATREPTLTTPPKATVIKRQLLDILSNIISNNPLSDAVNDFGFISRPTWLPTNLPAWPSKPIETSLSTSDDARRFPWLLNSPSRRGNWLWGYDINTDVSERWPNTGRTVKYTLKIQNSTSSPDGVNSVLFKINGQFPGPLIECNWGDWLEITVVNELKNNGTSMHWHGFRQLRTNTEDGTGGITECPIPPGGKRTYRFQATHYGSTWYHSHFSAQYGDGIVGPMIINGPAAANYDIDVGPVLLTDVYPVTVFQQDWIVHRVGPVTAANYLVNGKNVSPDGTKGSRATFKFTKGKKHLLRLVNAAVDQHWRIRIDGHKLIVIANDNVPIVPYVTDEVSIAVGQRYDIVVVADQPVGNYYLRAVAASACGRNQNNGLGIANAVVTYAGAPNTLPTTTTGPVNPQCFDELASQLDPIVTVPVDPTGFVSGFQNLNVSVSRARLTTGDLVFLWFINGVSETVDWRNPSLAQAVTGNYTFARERAVTILPKDDVWTFWVIQNQFFVPHPMHLHGHDFSVLGQGNGTFTPSQHLSLLNFENPTRRDVVMLIASGWTVIAFRTDNPGAWLMHCHIAWHVGEGLSVQFLERTSEIPTTYGATIKGKAFQDNCANFNTYATNNPAYIQSDSGLKRRDDIEMQALERRALDIPEVLEA